MAPKKYEQLKGNKRKGRVEQQRKNSEENYQLSAAVVCGTNTGILF